MISPSFAVSVNNLTKLFKSVSISHQQIQDGYFIALNKISFDVLKNSVCVIAGANGAGKTVLMSIIAGLEAKTSGEIFIDGRSGIAFQDADAQILGETPSEDISFGPKNLKLSKSEIKLRVQKSLEAVGLLDKADFPARLLSGGEKKRLAIGGILAMEADIIILDEPYANLDYLSICLINNLIVQMKKESKTIIVLTHEIEKILALSNQFMVLHKGVLVFDGKAEDGILCGLEKYSIKNPLNSYKKLEDLIWL